LKAFSKYSHISSAKCTVFCGTMRAQITCRLGPDGSSVILIRK